MRNTDLKKVKYPGSANFPLNNFRTDKIQKPGVGNKAIAGLAIKAVIMNGMCISTESRE